MPRSRRPATSRRLGALLVLCLLALALLARAAPRGQAPNDEVIVVEDADDADGDDMVLVPEVPDVVVVPNTASPPPKANAGAMKAQSESDADDDDEPFGEELLEGEVDGPLPEPEYWDSLVDAELLANRICFAMRADDGAEHPRPAYVEVNYIPPSQGNAAIAIYHLLDQPLMGAMVPPDEHFAYLCTFEAKHAGECREVGEILFRNPKPRSRSGAHGGKGDGRGGQRDRPRHAPVLSEVVHFDSVKLPYAVRYNVTKTGLYCIIGMPLPSLTGEAAIADATITYVNAHGLLPAVDYPKLPYYGFTALAWLAVLLVWLGKASLHWREMLKVQLYLAGLLGVLVVDTTFNWWYLADWNARGDYSPALLLLAALLNAARNSASLFVLLIVALGYGTLQPSLGPVMRKCQLLAVIHLIFGALWTGLTLKTPGDGERDNGGGSGWLVLVALPLSATITLFYIWSLTALTATTHKLAVRRQHVKLELYKWLWRLLAFAGVNLVAYFIANAVWFARRGDVAFIARWWTVKWFLSDGWMNMLYSVCMLAVCSLLRPTEHNARYGLEELVSDPLEDEFDLGRMSTDYDADSPAPGHPRGSAFGAKPGHGYPGTAPPPYRAGAHSADGGSHAGSLEHQVVFALDSDSDSDDERAPAVRTSGAAQPARLRSRSPSPRRG